MCLVVSGGNTLLVKVDGYTDFEIIGRTRDDAAGEALDKAARTMGLPYPGGVNLDRISQNGDDKAYSFPKPRVDASPLDFSFSGLKTSVINTVHNAEQKGETIIRENLGASFINAVVTSLIDNTEKAMQTVDTNKLVLAGGVSANSVLRRRMDETAKKHGWRIYYPELSLCGDNAAMVASQGYYEFISGKRADMSLNAYATMNITEANY